MLVFLALAAQYESWLMPLAVLLAVPTGVFGAFLSVLLWRLDNNIYVQIGIIMIIGLAAKNAVLIVEFARERRAHGASINEAATDAARLRFRPILMTSFAFIIGVVPLMFAHGAGAASRQSLGSTVFAGHARGDGTRDLLHADALRDFPAISRARQEAEGQGDSRSNPAARGGAGMKRAIALMLIGLLTAMRHADAVDSARRAAPTGLSRRVGHDRVARRPAVAKAVRRSGITRAH